MVKKIIFMSLILLTYASVSTASTESFSCNGYEPFWRAEVSDNSVNIDLFGEDKEAIKVLNVNGAIGYQESFIKVYSSSSGPAAIVKKAKCAESPSDEDTAKSYEAYLFTNSGTLYGCCDKKK